MDVVDRDGNPSEVNLKFAALGDLKLRVSYTEHRTNVSIRAEIQAAIGKHEQLNIMLTTVRRRKMRWYGHINRSSGLHF